MRPSPPRLPLVLAIGLAAGATLLYEVAITRILSVVLWYHFAFLSVSLALFGIGVPGVWFARRPAGERTLAVALIAAGLAVPGSVIAIFKLGGPLKESGRYFTGLTSVLHAELLLVVVSLLVPLLCLGSAICVLLMQVRGRDNGVLYGADLLGAAIGSAIVVPLMHAIPTPLIVAGTGFLPLAAAALLWPRRRAGVAALVACAVLVALMAWGEPFRLHYSKEYREPGELLHERWTPTARITVFRSELVLAGSGREAFLWGQGSRYDSRDLDQLWIEQDGSAGTPITRLDGSLAALTHLDYDVTSAGVQLARPKRVCVIGAGGGRDILTALRAGARSVDAVELNPYVIDAVSKVFGSFSGDVYHLPGVRPIAAEGRSFLGRSTGTYDLIQISLADSWASTAAGAFALSENYLYTVEALRTYWRRLAPDGVVSISRYRSEDRLLESSRLALLAVRALELEGVREPRTHLAVVGADRVANVMFSRRPLDAAWLARLDSICAERGFEPLWPPRANTPPDSPITEVLAHGSRRLAAAGIDLTPPTDDRPFFFQMLPVFGSVERLRLERLSVNDNAVTLLRGLLVIVSALAALLLVLPLFDPQARRSPALLKGTAYFAVIGLGFMLIEAPWIQRFILYLGHPSHATTIVLAALLLGAGLGSLCASRIALETARRWAGLLPLVLAGLNFGLSPLFDATLGQPFAVRALISFAAIAPAGFLMGFCFPLGMVAFGDASKAWFWAVNGATGVVASVLSLVVAMAIGLSGTAYLGVAAYAVAALLYRSAGSIAPGDGAGAKPQSIRVARATR